MKETARLPRQKGKAPSQPERRVFLGAAASAFFVGVSIQFLGCGDNNGVSVEPGDVEGSISSNHGHQAVVTKAQLDAGGAMTLDIRGGALHSHTIDLSAEDMAAIQAGTKVVKTSTPANNHSHTVTFH